ncbi:MAG: prephenate dehydrogenase/arogenate dehydrogenase family protein [Ilumatobacteraceae bacterium]
MAKRANVLGLGLIGGSVAAALRGKGWHVSGADEDGGRETDALTRGFIDARGIDPLGDISFVATPVSTVASGIRRLLDSTRGVVTDVGSVKAPIVEAITDPRFVGGHPMAGSELQGLDGADADLFRGAVWVLCPSSSTSDETFAVVAALVREIGGDVLALPANRHDQLVAVTSHLPHLAAATLLSLARTRADDHAAVMRLAAGGFRDMTRVASGHPAIWLDICRENQSAIVDAIDAMIDGLSDMRKIVDETDSAALLARLNEARTVRSNLPGRVRELTEVAEVRIPIPDRPGAAAEVFTLAAELGVNTANFEVTHSVEGDRGILVMVVDVASVELFRGGLLARGFKPAIARVV